MAEASPSTEQQVAHRAESLRRRPEAPEAAVDGATLAAPVAPRHAIAAPPGALKPKQVISLQRTVGNRSVRRLLATRRHTRSADATGIHRLPEPKEAPEAEETAQETVDEAVGSSLGGAAGDPGERPELRGLPRRKAPKAPPVKVPARRRVARRAARVVQRNPARSADDSVRRDSAGGTASPNPKTTFTDARGSYTVTAKTLKEAAAKISKREEAGKTDWKPKYTVDRDDSNSVTKATVTVTITVTMPSWAGADKLNAADKAKWDSFLVALEAHEQGHVKLVRENLEDVGQSMVGQKEDAASQTFKDALKTLKDASDAYDAENDHGRKEGTEIDIGDEAGDEKTAEGEGVARVVASPSNPGAGAEWGVLRWAAASGDAARSRSESRAAGPEAPVRAVIARRGDYDPLVPPELKGLPDDLSKLSEAEKVAKVQELLSSGANSGNLDILWNSFGDRELEVARSHPDLFQSSIKISSGVAYHQPFKDLREKFKADVENTALAHLNANRTYVSQEMEKLGATGVPDRDENSSAAQDHELHEVQKIAKILAECKKAIAGFKQIPVGYTYGFTNYGGGQGVTLQDKSKKTVTLFQPAGPPEVAPGPDDAGKMKTWQEVNAQYIPVAALKAGLEERSPAALYLGQEGDAEGVAGGDIKQARAEVGKGMQLMMGKIEKAVPLVGSDLKFDDFPPIQQALFSGLKAPSGTKWADPVEQAVAKDEVKDAEISHLLATLGIGALTAAAFILAEFATMGLATFLLAGAGVALSVGQAAASWDKYSDLSKAADATVKPELAIVSKEQADSALFTAILDTAFAFLDVAGAVKLGGKAAKYGAKMLEAAEKGAEKSAELALKDATRGAAGAAAVEKAVTEIGVEGAQKASGKSVTELAEIAGRDTPTGKKLLASAEAGAKAAEAAEKLPKLAEMVASGAVKQEELGAIMLNCINQYGHIGTIRRAGGWKKLMAVPGIGGGPMGTLFESWRKGLLAELQEYLAKETDDATKAVRTGTTGATSDLDVQAVGGAAAMNADRANQWLAGRLGCSKEELAGMLDMSVFVDPARAHLQDIVKGLTPELRNQIAAKQAGLEKKLIYASRLDHAKGNEALIKEITEEAAANGVSDIPKFKALTEVERAEMAKQVDPLVKELEAATDAGKKAKLVEDIGQKQAIINASNPDAYLGGGVRMWVSERDAAALAEAGIKMETQMSREQRIIAALSEGKFFDEAVTKLAKPGQSVDKIAGALKDIGKHGERVTIVLKGETKVGAEALEASGKRLVELKDAYKTGELVGRMNSAQAIEKEIKAAQKMLGELKAQSSAAIKALEKDVQIANLSASEVEKLVFWQKFNSKLTTVADQISFDMAGYLEGVHTALSAAEQDEANGTAPANPDANYQPGSGGPAVKAP